MSVGPVKKEGAPRAGSGEQVPRGGGGRAGGEVGEVGGAGEVGVGCRGAPAPQELGGAGHADVPTGGSLSHWGGRPPAAERPRVCGSAVAEGLHASC